MSFLFSFSASILLRLSVRPFPSDLTIDRKDQSITAHSTSSYVVETNCLTGSWEGRAAGTPSTRRTTPSTNDHLVPLESNIEMTSSNIYFAALTLEDDGDESSAAPDDRKPAPPDDVLNLRPETSVFMEDGLFVRIASFSELSELLRLCTLSKSDIERRCELVMKCGGIKKDPRRLERLSSEETWATVLRERIALDKELVFTVGHVSIMEHAETKKKRKYTGHAYVNEVSFSQQASLIPAKWNGAICGRVQTMRTGVHRAVFTVFRDHICFQVGILGASALRDSLPALNVPLAAGHKTFMYGKIFRIGLEVDIERRVMRVYHGPATFRIFRLVDSISFKHLSPQGYYWAVYGKDMNQLVNGDGLEKCIIERVNVPFESYRRPFPVADRYMTEGNQRSRRQVPGRFSNTSTRQHFDPYSSPPPSP